ncbi:MAG: late competence development ComFB family protein [Gemmatimonadales bacterium]
MTIRNLVEERVLAAYDRLRPDVQDFCGCDVCRSDVLVFALNRLPARYVATLEGSIMTELRLDSDQNRADLDVTLMEGFRKVSMAPRCGRKGPVS